ncbi:MAG: hypothetical protein AAFV25_06670 [Bacteroidota bacterium]
MRIPILFLCFLLSQSLFAQRFSMGAYVFGINSINRYTPGSDRLEGLRTGFAPATSWGLEFRYKLAGEKHFLVAGAGSIGQKIRYNFARTPVTSPCANCMLQQQSSSVNYDLGVHLGYGQNWFFKNQRHGISWEVGGLLRRMYFGAGNPGVGFLPAAPSIGSGQEVLRTHEVFASEDEQMYHPSLYARIGYFFKGKKNSRRTYLLSLIYNHGLKDARYLNVEYSDFGNGKFYRMGLAADGTYLGLGCVLYYDLGKRSG